MHDAPAATSILADDQASGLRRLVGTGASRWTLVLMSGLRNADLGVHLLKALAPLDTGGRSTLVIDAARTQVAAAAGLGLRFDLEHVLAGDCDISEACVPLGVRTWILPAGRAVDGVAADPARGRVVASSLEAIASSFDETVLLLPAQRAAWTRQLAPLQEVGQAVIPVCAGPESSAAILTAIRLGVSDAEIGEFALLFLGLGEATAGRLLSGMAAITLRHFGARVRRARTIADAPAGPARSVPGVDPASPSESGS